MTKEEAIKVRDCHLKYATDSEFPNGVVNAWITNIQGTDFWFIDVHRFCDHWSVKDSFDKVGFDEYFR